MRSLLSKKGEIATLQNIVTTLMIVGILLGVTFLVLEQFMGQMESGSEAEAGVNETIQAMKNIPTFLPIIVIVAIVGVLLAIVFTVLPRTGAGV
jgi:hypothetical protein